MSRARQDDYDGGAALAVSSDEWPLLAVRNLRHLRVFLEVLDGFSVGRAAQACNLSQPAVTQAMAKLEVEAGLPLFQHRARCLFPTEAGLVLAARVRRALGRLDLATAAVSPRLTLTATASQLRALVAVCEAGDLLHAAERLARSPSSVSRAISGLEASAGTILFERTVTGLTATPAARTLANAARLATTELDQAAMELGELSGRSTGRIVVGSLALAKSTILPHAIARFRQVRPNLPLRLVDSPYDDLVASLRRGEIDLLIGALRDVCPSPDVVQIPLFEDELVIVAGPDHPLANRCGLTVADVHRFPWAVSHAGTPSRRLFDSLFKDSALPPPNVVESSSLTFIRELLALTDYLGWVSRLRAATEVRLGLLHLLDLPVPDTAKTIGLTTRSDWLPSPAHRDFLDCINGAVAGLAAPVPAPVKVAQAGV